MLMQHDCLKAPSQKLMTDQAVGTFSLKACHYFVLLSEDNLEAA